MRGLASLFAGMLLAACGGSDEPAPSGARAAPVAEPATPHRAEVGGSCVADADCGWDDDCVPHACVLDPEPSPVCEETAPPPGTCACLFGRCTLRPNEHHRADPGPEPCESHGPSACGLDVGRATCEAGRPDDLADQAPRWTGPRCWCDGHPPRVCRFEWVDEVACSSVEDCWVEVDPFPRPIARPAAMRGRTFEPCRDGELAPGCEAGRCTLVGFGC